MTDALFGFAAPAAAGGAPVGDMYSTAPASEAGALMFGGAPAAAAPAPASDDDLFSMVNSNSSDAKASDGAFDKCTTDVSSYIQSNSDQ